MSPSHSRILLRASSPAELTFLQSKRMCQRPSRWSPPLIVLIKTLSLPFQVYQEYNLIRGDGLHKSILELGESQISARKLSKWRMQNSKHVIRESPVTAKKGDFGQVFKVCFIYSRPGNQKLFDSKDSSSLRSLKYFSNTKLSTY